MKTIADMLTGLRLMLALTIIGIASTRPPEHGVASMAVVTLAAWTTDWLDGALARRAANARQTWLGANDIVVDLVLASSLAFTLIVWKGASALAVAGILLVTWLWWRSFRAVSSLQLGMGLIYLLFVRMVWLYEPAYVAIFLGFVALGILIYHRRLRVHSLNFVHELRRLARAAGRLVGRE